MNPQTTLTDGNITLRPWQPTDVEPVYEAVQESVEEMRQWMPNLTTNLKREEISEWIEEAAKDWAEGTAYGFVITDARTGALLGGCGINHIQPYHLYANLFYWVRTGGVGRGAATSATRLLGRFGVEQLHLNRIEIIVAVDNIPSLRVAEKAGATREGILRKRVVAPGGVYNAVSFSFAPGDF